MTDFDINELIDRAQVYDSFVQLLSGANRYKLHSLQSVDPNMPWDHLIRVADNGQYYLNQEIVKQLVNMKLRLTSDEVDTVWPPTNTNTVSYYIYQKNLRNSVLIQLSIVYYARYDTSGTPYMRLNISGELTEIGMPRVNGDGDVELDIQFQILLNHPSTGADISPSFVRSSS